MRGYSAVANWRGDGGGVVCGGGGGGDGLLLEAGVGNPCASEEIV